MKSSGFTTKAAARIRPFVCLAAATALLAATGCGNTYRPVVTSINPVGPASQPTKYAVAISNPGAGQPGLVTVVDVSGDSVLVTPNIGVNPQYLILGLGGSTAYTLNGDGTLNTFGISSSLQTRNVLQTTLLSGSAPVSFFPQGSYDYIAESGRNAVAELNGSPPALQQEFTTGAGTVYVVGNSGASRVYALAQGTATGTAYPAGTAVAIETTTNTTSNTITVGKQPVYGVMNSSNQRAFIMNKQDGTVSVINAQTNQLDSFPVTVGSSTLTSTIAVGTAPVWADFAPTLSELFVLNQGNAAGFAITSYTINASNTITFTTTANSLTAGQTVTLGGFGTSTFLNGLKVFVSATGLSSTSFQAFVAHAQTGTTTEAGNGIASGSVSIVSVPLCSVTVVTSNPNSNCDVNNPVDAQGFGTILGTIPVGPNAQVIGVLQDGSQAYVANMGSAAMGIPGSVSVINLQTETVVATLPASNASTVTASDTLIHGNPNFLAVTTGTPTGKVYITAPNSKDLTLIETDTDQVFAHIPLQGTGVMVRVSTP